MQVCPQPHASATPLRPLRMHRGDASRQRGATLIEVVVCVTLLAIGAAATILGMLASNRMAASSRVMTAARAVVQRNIDEALSLGFKSGAVPSILTTTSASGVVYDDDGGNDNVVNLTVQENGTTKIVTGTLRRIVTLVANSENADIRRVTFNLTYTYRGRNYAVEMTTLRAIDD